MSEPATKDDVFRIERAVETLSARINAVIEAHARTIYGSNGHDGLTTKAALHEQRLAEVVQDIGEHQQYHANMRADLFKVASVAASVAGIAATIVFGVLKVVFG